LNLATARKRKRKRRALSLYLFDIRTGEKSGGAHPFGWLRESLVAIAGAAQKAWRIPIKDRRTVFFFYVKYRTKVDELRFIYNTRRPVVSRADAGRNVV